MKKICCFCERWESGGIESFLFNLLTHMDLSEFQVDIVAAQVKKSIFTAGLLKCGVSLIELGGSKYNIFKNRRAFKRLLRDRNYSAVYINAFQGMSLYYAKLAKRNGVPLVIAHSHNAALRPGIGYGLKMCLHHIYSAHFSQYADRFWACSEAAAKFMFPQKLLEKCGFTFIPNGIDVQRFQFEPEARERIRQAFGIENSFLIGCVGRLCYQKNQMFALRLLADVLERDQTFMLVFAGDGADKEKLRNEAQRLGISSHVLFLGTTDQVHELYSAMDMLAFPSRFEGFGIVAIEAQASGLPVFCSDRVPKEAVCTRLCERLPLDRKAWADALIHRRRLDRKERAAASAEAVQELKRIFDMAHVAKTIQGAFS